MFDQMSDDENELYGWMGLSLMSVQRAERAVGATLTIAFHEGTAMTVESIERQDADSRRRTLGNLLKKLKERAAFAPEIETILDRFLENRNILVHHFCNRPEFDGDQQDGHAAAIEFLRKLVSDAVAIAQVFLAVLCRWQEIASEAAAGTTMDSNDRTDLANLKEVANLIPSVEQLVWTRAKE